MILTAKNGPVEAKIPTIGRKNQIGHRRQTFAICRTRLGNPTAGFSRAVLPPQPFVWRWSGKRPLMYCENCNTFFPLKLSHPPSDESPPQRPPISAVPDLARCCYCDREADPELRFCPLCGSASR
ncbi:hypothetical protein U1Q18_000370 [Sarracenia purpurea var. burkii]